MSYCPNPDCVQPVNPPTEEFCVSCGRDLIVGDRYRILQPISAGGFGTTFLAIDEDDEFEGDRRCVLKRFSLRLQNSAYAEKAAQLFQDEAARLQDLIDHPQIPRWLDQFDHDGDPYLVQDYIDGQTLETVLAEQGAFSESQVQTVLLQLLPVLDHIHRCRIIHRDLKPANIILPSGGGRLVLVDFGASKYATNTVLARTGTMIGSAGYAAPEQILGKATFASDLYSLGVTCLHLLTAIHPFDLYSIAEDRWVWRDFLPHPVSDRLVRVLDGLLYRPLSQRYPRAADVLQDLQRVTVVKRDRSIPGAQSNASKSATLNPSRAGVLQRPVLREHSPSRRSVAPSVLYTLDHTLVGHEASVNAIALSPGGQRIISSSRENLCFWNGQTGELIHRFPGRSPNLSLKSAAAIVGLGLALNPPLLLTVMEDGGIKVWDLHQRTLKASWSVEGWGISAVALSSDGELLALGSGDGRVQVWDLVEKRAIATVHRHRDRITALTFTEDGEWLVSSSGDRTIRVWDVGAIWESGQCELLNTFKVSDRPTAIAFSPNEEALVSAGERGELRLWNLATNALIKTIPAHRAAIATLACSPKGHWLASGSDDSTLKLWAWEHPSTLEYTDQLTASWAVKSLAFTGDQQTLVSGNQDGTVQIWRQT
ncbi:MAG: serine/threonine protein kinase [Synechococcales cyanobacterium T60_A2020_003]|nr:serine/threonine protein kinase [Synechococcales cyanobacterium T60_A2020_003]